MAGSVFDFSNAANPLPDVFVVDTNIVAERLLDPVLAMLPDRNLVHARRANEFFVRLDNEKRSGLVTQTVFSELVHLAIKFSYQQDAVARGRSKSN